MYIVSKYNRPLVTYFMFLLLQILVHIFDYRCQCTDVSLVHVVLLVKSERKWFKNQTYRDKYIVSVAVVGTEL